MITFIYSNIRICEDCISLRIALLKAEDRVEKLGRQYTEIKRKYIKLSEELEEAKRNKQQHWLQKFQYFSERIVQVKLGNYLNEKRTIVF